MYIRELQSHDTFTDQRGKPWPRGTIIVLEPFPQHCGFLDYTPIGEQILLHKAKKEGRPVITGPKGFMDSPVRYRVRVPQSDQQADEWLNHAYAEIEAGVPWMLFDECQDFVSRAVTGHAGSPTRDGILGCLAFAGGLALAAKLFS